MDLREIGWGGMDWIDLASCLLLLRLKGRWVGDCGVSLWLVDELTVIRPYSVCNRINECGTVNGVRIGRGNQSIRRKTAPVPIRGTSQIKLVSCKQIETHFLKHLTTPIQIWRLQGRMRLEEYYEV
jgi:hypothetical protein